MTQTPPRGSDTLQRLNALIDGELDAANTLDLERLIAENPELRALHARLAAARDAVRSAAPRARPTAEFRARIASLGEAAPALRPRRAPNSYGLRALAASLTAVAVTGLLAWSLRSGGDSENGELQALVTGYIRAQVSGQPIDVASSDRHTVKPWLAARVTLGADVVDLAAYGYPLVGGRIDIVDRSPVPTLVYRRREHLISVSELRDVPEKAAAGVWTGAVDGYHVERWSDSERTYVAVSDIDVSELASFVDAFRKVQKVEGGEAPAAKP